jgi:hypothetical protein
VPIFARRRLQAMLDDLSLTREKTDDFINRIESKEIAQALPGEMELALVWAIYGLGGAEIEPEWYSADGSLPDVFSEKLIPDAPTIIDVAALSDAALPGDQGMRNASRKLSQEANVIRRGTANHLSYYFFEETVRIRGESIRRICVPTSLQMTDYLRSSLNEWLSVSRSDGDKLRLNEDRLDVVITWNEQQQALYNFQTSMPPEIRSLHDNYIFRKLREKSKQLANERFDGLKCVILADVGSTALRNPTKVDHLRYTYNGGQVASKFLQSNKLDVVLIVTPRRERRSLADLRASIEWEQFVFCRPGLKVDTAGFERMLARLPSPRFEGYQARQLHEQRVFSPRSRGMYMGTNVKWTKGEKTEIQFSARSLLDMLAGRCSAEQFMRRVGLDDRNVFKYHLDLGETISSIDLNPGGLDEDDDQIVIGFSDDPAARHLKPRAKQPD